MLNPQSCPDNGLVVHLLLYKLQPAIDGHDSFVLLLLQENRAHEFVYIRIILKSRELLTAPIVSRFS